MRRQQELIKRPETGSPAAANMAANLEFLEQEIQEIFLQCGAYCGAPAALESFTSTLPIRRLLPETA